MRFFNIHHQADSDSNSYWQKLAHLRQELLGESSLRPTTRPLVPTHSQRVGEIVSLLRKSKKSGQQENKERNNKPPAGRATAENTAQQTLKETSCLQTVSCCTCGCLTTKARDSVDDFGPGKTKVPSLLLKKRTEKMMQSVDRKLREVKRGHLRQRFPHCGDVTCETKIITKNKTRSNQTKREEYRCSIEKNNRECKHSESSESRVSVGCAQKQMIDEGDLLNIEDGEETENERCLESDGHDSSARCQIQRVETLLAPAVGQQPPSKENYHVTWATPLHRLMWSEN